MFHRISLDTRFRGYDGTKASSFSSPHRHFRRRNPSTPLRINSGHEGFGERASLELAPAILDFSLRSLRLIPPVPNLWLRLCRARFFAVKISESESSFYVTFVPFVVKSLLRFGCGCAALGSLWLTHYFGGTGTTAPHFLQVRSCSSP